MRISADNSLKLAIQKLFKWLFCQKGATHLSAMDGKQKSFRAGQRQDMTKGTAGSKAGGLISPRVAAKAKGQGATTLKEVRSLAVGLPTTCPTARGPQVPPP